MDKIKETIINDFVMLIHEFFQKSKSSDIDFIINLLMFLKNKFGNEENQHVGIIVPEINEIVDAKIYTLVKYLNKIGIETYATCEEDLDLTKGQYTVQIAVKLSNKMKLIDLLNEANINPYDEFESDVIYSIYLNEENYLNLLKITINRYLDNIKKQSISIKDGMKQ